VKAGAAFRGQPILMLALLLGGWAGARAMMWDTEETEAAGLFLEDEIAAAIQTDAGLLSPAAAISRAGRVERAGPGAERTQGSRGFLPALFVRDAALVAPPWRSVAMVALPARVTPAPPIDIPLIAVLADGNVERPSLQPAPFVPILAAPSVTAGGKERRWSGDAWTLLRRDQSGGAASGPGSYGRSQAGAVLRYRLVPGSAHRPAAYARVSQAVGGTAEMEFALGVSARPLQGVPISVAAEGRVMQAGGRAFVRPAAYAVTELPPLRLPLGFSGEAYAQAGYVGGEFATPFVDGQMRLDRSMIGVGPVAFRAGGGAWGGAQRGVHRLDVGPSAALLLDLDGKYSRVSVDWRFRVAGDAEPSSGPALTISAGF